MRSPEAPTHSVITKRRWLAIYLVATACAATPAKSRAPSNDWLSVPIEDAVGTHDSIYRAIARDIFPMVLPCTHYFYSDPAIPGRGSFSLRYIFRVEEEANGYRIVGVSAEPSTMPDGGQAFEMPKFDQCMTEALGSMTRPVAPIDPEAVLEPGRRHRMRAIIPVNFGTPK